MIDVFMTNRYVVFVQVSDLCKDYRRSMNAEITESMNTFWAECYESYKNALDTRSRLVAESRKSFQVIYIQYTYRMYNIVCRLCTIYTIYLLK